MNEVNKTLYIPLYGKAYVSEKGLFLTDKKAEEIWQKAQFKLKGKSKSKYLAYYMAIRALDFDNYVKEKINDNKDAVIIHFGCGLDSRVLRISDCDNLWYDIDLLDVINERKKYYNETDKYKMLVSNTTDNQWLHEIKNKSNAIILLEGVSMYLSNEQLTKLIKDLSDSFNKISLLMDCYTIFAAKMSKYKNPVKDVGVNKVYGIDDPTTLETDNFKYIKEHDMIPKKYINNLKGIEKMIFSKLYAGGFSKKLYKLYEYRK